MSVVEDHPEKKSNHILLNYHRGLRWVNTDILPFIITIICNRKELHTVTVCSVRWVTSYLEWCISYPKALLIVITHAVWGSRFSDSHFEKQRQMVPHLRSHAHAHVFSSGEDSTALLSWDKTYFFFSLCSSLTNSPSLPPSCPYLLSVFLCCRVSQTGSRPLFLFFREYVHDGLMRRKSAAPRPQQVMGLYFTDSWKAVILKFNFTQWHVAN